MERDGFPERYHVLPRPRLGHFLVGILDRLPTMLPKTPFPSDHANRGAAPMLDEELDEVIISLHDGAYPPAVCDGFEAAYRETRG